jgi:hypothetical protein
MLIKSILVHFTNPFFNSQTVTLFHLEVEAACSSSCRAVSWLFNGHTAHSYNTSTGETLASRGNTAS